MGFQDIIANLTGSPQFLLSLEHQFCAERATTRTILYDGDPSTLVSECRAHRKWSPYRSIAASPALMVSSRDNDAARTSR